MKTFNQFLNEKVATGPRLGELRQKGATHMNAGEQKKISKRTKEWMGKKGMKGAPGSDAMKARTAEHKARRGVKNEAYKAVTNAPDSLAKMNQRYKPVKKKEPTDTPFRDRLKKEEVVDEGIRKKIKVGMRLAKREAERLVVDDPGNPYTYGSLGNPKPGDKAKRDKERAAKKKKMNEEDKAFNFVLDKIKKEVGKSGYVSKDNPRKPQSAADKAKARAHQAKVDAENAAERKKDPSQGRYPKG